MHKRNSYSRDIILSAISWFGIFCLLLSSTLNANALVLCQGDDGHVSVEEAINGSCESFPSVIDSDQSGFGNHQHSPKDLNLSASGPALNTPDSDLPLDSDLHCGPCDDYSLLNESASTESKIVYSVAEILDVVDPSWKLNTLLISLNNKATSSNRPHFSPQDFKHSSSHDLIVHNLVVLLI
jgi:hypothetical protein